ncbi:nucleotidyltransferase family protein [Marinococcus halotolerans]|uniref:nucleotidyltransferase family protein n=1 Tax=Marinococcus halotolerans TaxID=301092 RepID=UPI0003B5F439|nr:nucleotidyltransferase family protein [Marinococcus halotolerans]
MKTAVIYLAAGKSSRMGHNKLEKPWRNTTLGSSALQQVLKSSAEEVIIVTNQSVWIDNRIFEQNKRTVRLAASPQAVKGQAYSLRTGVNEAVRIGAEAVLVVLADQPGLTAETIDRLIAQARTQACDFAGMWTGHHYQPPMLFKEQMFAALQMVEGDRGAASILRTEHAWTGSPYTGFRQVEQLDVDTEEEYRWMLHRQQ